MSIMFQDIEPVLAVSYYEYAQSLANESSFDSAIVYYKYSDIIAGAVGFTNFSAGASSSSRYVGIPEKSTPTWRREVFNCIEYFIFFTVVGGIGGLGLGLIIGSISSKKQKEELYKRWVPRSINDYNKKQKDQHLSEGQIPRSIKDYYKKAK